MKRKKLNCLKCGKQIEKAKRGAPPPSQIVCAECHAKIKK